MNEILEVEVTVRYLKFVIPAVIAGLLYLSAAQVPAGHRGVVFSQGGGVQQAERAEGLTLVIPLWQRVYAVNVRTQVFTYESFVQTKDLQEITLPIAVNYHIDPTRASEVFQNIGPLDVVQRTLVEPAAFQASTQAAGQVIAEDVAKNREALRLAIEKIVADRLDDHGIIVEFVAIKDAVMDNDFIAAIKAKVIAEQKQIEAENLIQVAIAEAEQVRERAAGVADANRTIEASLTEDVLLYLRITKWDGVLPTTVVGASQDVLVGIE